jgi:hypothetical protein
MVEGVSSQVPPAYKTGLPARLLRRRDSSIEFEGSRMYRARCRIPIEAPAKQESRAEPRALRNRGV